jgi:membrane protein
MRVVERAFRQVGQWLDPIVRGMARARTLGLAAEMSFWLFLSLVPLAAVAGMVAARLAMSHQPLEGSFLSSVEPEARDLIHSQVELVAHWNSGKIAPVALIIFVWLASTGVHSVFDALEVQSETTRPWWKKRLLAFATCVGMSVGVALLGVLAIGVDRLAFLAGRAVSLPGGGETLARDVARSASGFAISVAMIAALYRVGIPREARHRTPILPGALIATMLVVALGWGYRLYLSSVGGEDAYLGGLAIIGVTLTTLWLFSVALLLGTQVNTVLRDWRASRSRTPSGGARGHALASRDDLRATRGSVTSMVVPAASADRSSIRPP